MSGLFRGISGGALIGTGGGGLSFEAPSIPQVLSGAFFLESTSVGTQTDMPFEIMVPLIGGDLPSGSRLVAKDGETTLAIQEDNSSTDANDDKRLTKITGILPTINALQRKTITITAEVGSPATGTDVTLADILATDYEITAKCTISATLYSAVATDGLSASATWSLTAATYHGKWRSGPYCTEYLVSVPLVASGPTEHSHLRAWFHIAAYKKDTGAVSGPNPITGIRTDVVIENGYFDVLSPADVTYDYAIDLEDGGTTTPVSRSTFVHWYAARYRDRIWWGTEAEFFQAHDWDYLRATQLVPNWDFDGTDVGVLSVTALDNDTAPLSQTSGKSRGVTHGMGGTGDRPDIGLMFATQMEGFARETENGYRWIIEAGDVQGWTNNHWRDDADGKIANPADYSTTDTTWRSFVSAGGGDKILFPGSSAEPWSLDQSHYPQLSYAPYLLTGDLCFAEEMQFLSQWLWGVGDPDLRGWPTGDGGPSNGYRRTLWNNSNGNNNGQQRLQAWNTRSLGHAALCTPDVVDGTCLGWSQTIARTWLDTNYDYYKSRSVDKTSSTTSNEAGKIYVLGGAKFLTGGDSSEWGGNIVMGDYQYAPWQVNYSNLVNHHMTELGVINADGIAFRDWMIAGVVDLAAKAGWGRAKDWMMLGYFMSYYDESRSGANEEKANGDYDYMWDVGARTFKHTGASSGSKRAWTENDVGASFSGTSGTVASPITVTMDSATFETPFSWYDGKYLFQSTNGADPGRGEIIEVTSSTVCTMRTDYTHPKNSSYDGVAFDTTSFAAGELRYPLPDEAFGTEATNGDGEGDKTYLQAARAAIIVAGDLSITDAAAAKTYIDSLAANFTGLSNLKFTYIMRP